MLAQTTFDQMVPVNFTFQEVEVAKFPDRALVNTKANWGILYGREHLLVSSIRSAHGNHFQDVEPHSLRERPEENRKRIGQGNKFWAKLITGISARSQCNSKIASALKEIIKTALMQSANIRKSWGPFSKFNQYTRSSRSMQHKLNVDAITNNTAVKFTKCMFLTLAMYWIATVLKDTTSELLHYQTLNQYKIIWFEYNWLHKKLMKHYKFIRIEIEGPASILRQYWKAVSQIILVNSE